MDCRKDDISIALGMNNAVDLEIVWDSKALEDLVVEYGITKKDIRKYSDVMDMRELLCSILYQVQAGEGIGCHVKDSQMVIDYASHFKFRRTMGGAGIRAAIVIRKFGYKSLIHLVSQSKQIREMIPEGCKYYCLNKQDTEYPHLIIQYPEGAEIHANDIDIVSTRANRLMYFDDKGIKELPLDEEFFKDAANCKTMMIGSFTSVEKYETGMERARTAGQYIDKYLKDTVIYYEDSCPPGGVKPELNDIWKTIVPKCDLYSMNEDELMNHIGQKVDFMDAKAIIGAIEDLYKIIPCKNYVIHSKSWAIIYGEDAPKYHDALQNAVNTSTTRLLNGDDITPADFEATKRRSISPEGLAFEKQIKEGSWNKPVTCVPSYLITEKNLTTIGLGDSFVGGFLAYLSDQLNAKV